MKSKIKQLIYFALCASSIIMLVAWPGLEAKAQKDALLTPQLEAVAAGGSTPNWIDFRQDTKVSPITIFTDLKAGFQLSENDQMTLLKTVKDQIGYSHYRYQQFYKNHKVLYGEFIVHQQADGFVKSANGRLITGLNLGSNAMVSQGQALESALNYMKAKRYLWQNPAMESELKRQEGDQKATYYPKGELVYAPNNHRATYLATDYRLTWNFKIYTDDKDVPAKTVFVDAVTGAVIHSTDLSMVCSSGTGTSAFNGSVAVKTLLSGSYTSHNDCQATDIYVYNCNGGGAANTLYSDGDNTWTATSQQSAVQCQYGAAQVYSYYLGEHSRSSWNGTSGDMIAYNNANAGQNNACWGCTGNSAIFYAGNTSASTDDWNSLDIVGHEFTHGVTQVAAGLVYQNESGALNESYSDIFGEMVESWSVGNCDFLVGADRGAIRSFSNPNAFNDPDTYLGTNWYTGTSDHGGVHTNSGVQNFWFYLISNGGSGTNDLGKSYNVTAIGRFKARDIAYRALELYETSSTQYIDARAATLRAAFDLYGGCSPEIQAVGDAWHAVGVESQSGQFVNDVCGVVTSGSFKQAISVLTGNSCGTGNIINGGLKMTYYAARDRIILYAGFRAPEGTRFTAYLEPCSATLYRGNGTDNVTMSDAEKGIFNSIVTEKQPTITLTAEPENVSIFPNPFKSSFAVTIKSIETDKAQFSIFNSLGERIEIKTGITLNKGNNMVNFDGSKLGKGVYMIEIVTGNTKTVKKIVKM